MLTCTHESVRSAAGIVQDRARWARAAQTAYNVTRSSEFGRVGIGAATSGPPRRHQAAAAGAAPERRPGAVTAAIQADAAPDARAALTARPPHPRPAVMRRAPAAAAYPRPQPGRRRRQAGAAAAPGQPASVGCRVGETEKVKGSREPLNVQNKGSPKGTKLTRSPGRRHVSVMDTSHIILRMSREFNQSREFHQT